MATNSRRGGRAPGLTDRHDERGVFDQLINAVRAGQSRVLVMGGDPGVGKTVLQPGIDLLQDAPDFPDDGPILIITDAWIDRVRIKRDHAFLIPAGAVLPFPARGPVFRFS